MKYIILIISFLLTVRFKDSALSLLTGLVLGFNILYLIFCKSDSYSSFEYENFQDDAFQNKTHRSKNKSSSVTHRSHKHMNSYQIERYAEMCNAYLEHEDEMAQYSNDYDIGNNIKND